jgi:hypothetical protein
MNDWLSDVGLLGCSPAGKQLGVDLKRVARVPGNEHCCLGVGPPTSSGTELRKASCLAAKLVRLEANFLGKLFHTGSSFCKSSGYEEGVAKPVPS